MPGLGCQVEAQAGRRSPLLPDTSRRGQPTSPRPPRAPLGCRPPWRMCVGGVLFSRHLVSCRAAVLSPFLLSSSPSSECCVPSIRDIPFFLFESCVVEQMLFSFFLCYFDKYPVVELLGCSHAFSLFIAHCVPGNTSSCFFAGANTAS